MTLKIDVEYKDFGDREPVVIMERIEEIAHERFPWQTPCNEIRVVERGELPLSEFKDALRTIQEQRRCAKEIGYSKMTGATIDNFDLTPEEFNLLVESFLTEDEPEEIMVQCGDRLIKTNPNIGEREYIVAICTPRNATIPSYALISLENGNRWMHPVEISGGRKKFPLSLLIDDSDPHNTWRKV